MAQQVYVPVAASLGLSALIAALPIAILLYFLGVRRTTAWKAGLLGLLASFVVALTAYRMPLGAAVSAVGYGAAFGLFPICWVIIWAIYLYRVTVETGQFSIVKDSVGSLTSDRRLQALLIAFCFGAFIEGAAGFGAPVAVAAAMLTGLGFSPFYAAAICLLANTAPVAFGSIGIPVVTLAAITGLPVGRLSAAVGLISAPLALIIPAYLIVIMGGWKALRGVWKQVMACGVSFSLTLYVVSNFLGPQLTNILSSLVSMGVLVLSLQFWKPADTMQLAGDSEQVATPHHSPRQVFLAWAPYLLLVIFVLLWGIEPVKTWLNAPTATFGWPGLHNQILRVPPVVSKVSPYPALFTLNWLSASGTSCLLAAFASALLLGLSPRRAISLLAATLRQLAFPILTVVVVLGMAFLMNYSGATATLGLACASTHGLFPFFGTLLGWVGVFLTGSDTSSNALFGNLQVVTANQLKLNPVLMAAANSTGGVMGKMISLQSIAVACAATGMAAKEEARLFRFTLRHSVFLAVLVGIVVVCLAYIFPSLVT